MYDSITSRLVRLARRSWWIVAAALVFGGIAGALISDRRASWTGSATIQVADVSTLVQLLGLGGDQGIEFNTSVQPLATRAAEDFSASKLGETNALTVRVDESSGVILATASGTDEDDVRAVLAEFESAVERRATDPRVSEVDVAIAATTATMKQHESSIAELDDQFASMATDDPARETVVQTQLAQKRDLAALQGDLNDLKEYRGYLDTDLVSTIGITVTEPVSPVVGVVVGVIVMGVLLTVVGVALVLLDHRVRRRIQLERLLPGTTVLGVLPTGTADDFARAAARSVERFGIATDAPRVRFVATNGDAATAVRELLEPLTEFTLVDGEGDDAADALVVVATWGRSSEAEIASRVAALESATTKGVAVLLVSVPPRDIAWAGATGRGADADV